MLFRITQLEGLLISDNGVNNEQQLVHDGNQSNHFRLALTLLLIKSLHIRIIGLFAFIRPNVGGSDMEKRTPDQSGTTFGNLVA